MEMNLRHKIFFSAVLCLSFIAFGLMAMNSEQLSLIRLERYARPAPLNVHIGYSDTIMTVTYTGAEATADITVTGDSIYAEAPASTVDANFTEIALGDSASGCVRAIDACIAINAYTGYTCSLFAGADPFLCIDFLAAAADTDITSGGQLAATAAKNRAIGTVIAAQGGHMKIYAHQAFGNVTAAHDVKLAIYDGGSIGDLIWQAELNGWEATVIDSGTYQNLGPIIFPGPGLTGSDNEEMVFRLLSDGNTLTAGELSIQATTHGY